MAYTEPDKAPPLSEPGDASAGGGLRRRKGPVRSEAATDDHTAPGTDENVQQDKDTHAKQDAPLGKTPDGTVFKIPQTHNMLSSLFDPRLPKSNIDLLTLFLLGLQLVLFVSLSRPTARLFFGLYFAMWRTGYDAGLGYVLKRQSETRWIVRTVKTNGWFDDQRRPKVAQWAKSELRKKMGKGYDFNSVPLEFNVWILFRHGVDVILLNDFLSYVLFSLSFLTWSGPPGHSALFHILRWVGGFTLLLFNLWVKTDAHRIVKDFAWYWGDAFFLSLQNLVFDGVFEFAPHPMYSVGYAGYYGLSLIVASPTVLFVSLAAHAAQFGFLLYFENPHIERTYGQRKPIAARTPLQPAAPTPISESPVVSSREDSFTEVSASGLSTPTLIDGTEASTTDAEEAVTEDDETDDLPDLMARKGPAPRKESMTPSMLSGRSGVTGRRGSEYDAEPTTRHDLDNKYFHKDLLIFRNWDAFRARDLAFALVLVYAVVPPLLPSLSKASTISLLFLHALAWRGFHSVALGLALKKQSERRWIVRHFLKHYHYERDGDAVRDAFDNWKAIYNLSLCMTYVSFIALAWKCYTIPSDWSYGAIITRHTLGLLLLALQAWSSAETYEVLGPFGWFYGDFWIPDYPHELAVTGIYRFLNNPERSMGGAAFIGISLIAGSKIALAQALINIAAHWWFLSAVENPHMQRLYGNSLRKDAGVTKTLRNAVRRASLSDGPAGVYKSRKDLIDRISKNVREVQGTVEKVFEETADAVEDFISKSAPAVKGYVHDTRILLQQSGERFVISRVANDLASYDSSQYSLNLRPSAFPPLVPHASTSSAPSLRYHLGEPIHVKWTAPSNHSRRDWIGVYRLGANTNKLVTKVSSQGKWVGLFDAEWQGDRYEGVGGGEAPEHGEISPAAQARGAVVFKGKKLPWKTGQYEFRYHHDGKHSVVAASQPFEIFVDKPADYENYDSVHTALTHIVSKTLALDAEVVPHAALPLVEDAQRARIALGSDEDGPPTPTGLEPRKDKGKEKAPVDDFATSPQQRTVPLSDPDDFVLYSTDEAAHIAYAIECAFEVELDKEVVLAAANVGKLAAQLLEARKVLGVKPGDGGTGMKADLSVP
ncbi:hypothetical protein JCM8202_006219 [Rhodotorula sphaerocarpa]